MSTVTSEDDASAEPEMQSLCQLLARAINAGAPLYNSGKRRECFDLYVQETEFALQQALLCESIYGDTLEAALETAQACVQDTGNVSEGAWTLRRAFDEILLSPQGSGTDCAVPVAYSKRDSGDASVDSDAATPVGYWQDENVRNTSVSEKAQALADTLVVLKSSIAQGDNTWNGQVYPNSFPASAAVEQLISVGLAATRDSAAEKCALLLQARLIQPALPSVGKDKPATFEDGTQLYIFSDTAHRVETLDAMKEGSDSASETAHVKQMAVQLSLEDDAAPGGGAAADEVSISRLSLRRRSLPNSSERAKGVGLVEFLTKLEQHLKVKDRRYRLKTYPKCFVGSEAVDAAVKHGVSGSREEAVEALDQILHTGLLYHVTREHSFKDDKLFYRITTASDAKVTLDQLAASEDGSSDLQKVQRVALAHRYEQAGTVGFSVKEILNSFFGCTDEAGWDLVDLQNWRNNMKRWGFGWPADVDHEMNNILSPLTAHVDPDTWDVSGDEEWESPFGILAQVRADMLIICSGLVTQQNPNQFRSLSFEGLTSLCFPSRSDCSV